MSSFLCLYAVVVHICDKVQCCKNAHCEGGKCVCDDGYKGNGNIECKREYL